MILDYTFGDPRLQLKLNAGGGGSYYYEHVSGQNYDIDLKGIPTSEHIKPTPNPPVHA